MSRFGVRKTTPHSHRAAPVSARVSVVKRCAARESIVGGQPSGVGSARKGPMPHRTRGKTSREPRETRVLAPERDDGRNRSRSSRSLQSRSAQVGRWRSDLAKASEDSALTRTLAKAEANGCARARTPTKSWRTGESFTAFDVVEPQIRWNMLRFVATSLLYGSDARTSLTTELERTCSQE